MKIKRWMELAALVGFLMGGSAMAADTSGQERAEAAGKGLVGSPAPRIVVKTVLDDSDDLHKAIAGL